MTEYLESATVPGKGGSFGILDAEKKASFATPDCCVSALDLRTFHLSFNIEQIVLRSTNFHPHVDYHLSKPPF